MASIIDGNDDTNKEDTDVHVAVEDTSDEDSNEDSDDGSDESTDDGTDEDSEEGSDEENIDVPGSTQGLAAAVVRGISPRIPLRMQKDSGKKVVSRVSGDSNNLSPSVPWVLEEINSSNPKNTSEGVDLDSQKPTEDGGTLKAGSVSYAAAVTADLNQNGNSLSFYPLADKSDSKVEIPLELVKQSSAKYENTLYGYFLGPRLYFPTVQKDVKRLWGNFGFQEAMMNNHGFIFFRFSSHDGMRQVMEGGPWMIRGVPLFVFPWDPLQGLVKPEHKTCPLWIKLHNIPLVAFNREGVSRIASALGEPKMMDEYTTQMCDNAWGRPGFAKVLVDVWAVGNLKREISLMVPNQYGGKGMEVKVEVEYLWEPTQCSHCCVFGHKVSSCAKAEFAKQKLKGKPKQVVDDEGFTVVVNKKNKGIKISDVAPQPVPKPKPKQIYVPVKKPGGSTSGIKDINVGMSMPDQAKSTSKEVPKVAVQGGNGRKDRKDTDTHADGTHPHDRPTVPSTGTHSSTSDSNMNLLLAQISNSIHLSNAFAVLDQEGPNIPSVDKVARVDDPPVLGVSNTKDPTSKC
ncbi:hypothetical protein OSB04_029261 [Centaurea solstitialis]|uniref:DUF4283 domain-containing protein n=1 Tax=Centaurea solstitialis TaxID=347529 RepID=A0AA38SUS7_9ASTR|nr:hypothetical protein OSB04_029261 [Centaurea solstitialis]